MWARLTALAVMPSVLQGAAGPEIGGATAQRRNGELPKLLARKEQHDKRAARAKRQCQGVAGVRARQRGRSSLVMMPATMNTAPSSAVAGRRSPAMRPMMPAQTGSVA